LVPHREKGDELQVLVKRRRSRIGRIMREVKLLAGGMLAGGMS
jgi:hypothetical protein